MISVAGPSWTADPWTALRGWLKGVVLAVFIALVFGAWNHTKYPLFPASLKLASDVVKVGEPLQFFMAEPGAFRTCPEETRRMVFRLLGPTIDGPRRVIVINDWSAINTGAPQGSIVDVPLPELTPGTWYYQRHTAMWCTPLNWVFGPAVVTTDPLRFTVVAR